ncbi:MAG TPA: NAD(P)/FAD-dependent oxidoreductase [Candidatus Anaerobutyricum faecale]|uniref:NAD(P)/FAD-dependent oxidoreductase n=1 Tax=Eubacterium sp. An11 TaxID=1965542 RepID=UPI000B376F38|nr:NAD(P)/FAD-dependent oxidoreductase [Eubacterium sp. An11]OUQ69302.1 aminoacetone oxidase family FAD-binding enzyme [Eubacterium sp. An11]HJC31224.1 NAD(P)/FAD-dependent oxidoreductase [Candidatus Anaerobutyricum faecale]
MRKVIIIGGGAAGMMAAISASKEGKKVLLLEKNEKLGKKLFITGKGRCNITSACDPDEFLNHVATNSRFLYSSFSRFNNHDVVRLLNDAGLKTKVERGQRVFPQSDHSSDVIGTLKRLCDRNHVEILYHAKVEKILLHDHEGVSGEKNRSFSGVQLSDGRVIQGDSLIIATGGCSYTSTGSDGDGYRLARELGHSIRPVYPSLVPFIMKETWCRDLMGLTLKNISIRVKNGKKVIYEGFGEFLFTHFGVSGPLVLTASTCLGKYQKALEAGQLTLLLDLKPSLTMEQLEKRYLREFDTYRNKNISNVIERMLPRKMVPVFLREAGVPEDKKVRDITKKERRRMEELMKGMEMHITGVRGFEEAIVTRGGVNVKEVSPTTMESKLVDHVFFAGEILDVDAVTGGFNLQIAWSTGYTAGYSA